MEFVPIQSYHKATLAQLYDNEGEVFWDTQKLKTEIDSNPELVKKLKETGYKERSKSFTGEQISLIFKYLSRPILNFKNMKLLKIKGFDLLNNFEMKPELLKNNIETLEKLSDAVLSGLGLRKNEDPDFNPYYIFGANESVYFIRDKKEFIMHDMHTFRVLKVIKTTEDLIKELLLLKNTN